MMPWWATWLCGFIAGVVATVGSVLVTGAVLTICEDRRKRRRALG